MSEQTADGTFRVHDADPELQRWLTKAFGSVHHASNAHHPPETAAGPVQGGWTEDDVRADDVYRALEEILGRPLERGAPLPEPDELPPGVELPPEDRSPFVVRTIGHLTLHRLRKWHPGHPR
jgi:hypothetical protein